MRCVLRILARTRCLEGRRGGRQPVRRRFGYLVENYDHAKVKAELDRRGLNPLEASKRRGGINDPDGFPIEVAGQLSGHAGHRVEGMQDMIPMKRASGVCVAAAVALVVVARAVVHHADGRRRRRSRQPSPIGSISSTAGSATPRTPATGKHMMVPPNTPIDIAANAHLIKHGDTWMMFDTSTNDAYATTPGPGRARHPMDQDAGADAAAAAEGDRHHAGRHQVHRHLAQPRRSHRQHRAVQEGRSADSEARVRLHVQDERWQRAVRDLPEPRGR